MTIGLLRLHTFSFAPTEPISRTETQTTISLSVITRTVLLSLSLSASFRNLERGY